MFKITTKTVLLSVAAWVCTFDAHAAVSCTTSPGSGFIAVYDTNATANNVNSSTFTINCTRATTSDAATVFYSAASDDGLYNSGQNNKARYGGTANYINYDLFADAAFAINWSTKKNKKITGSLSFIGTSLSTSQTVTYYSKIVAAQTVVGQVTYSDTVGIGLSYGITSTNLNLTAATAYFPVSISTVTSCQIATPPGNISFTYTSFQASAATASTTFSARCSVNLGYTMSLDAYSGTVVGVPYTLSLSASSGTGNGALQSYTINGAATAGRGGTCATSAVSCTGSNTHVLTVSY